MIRNLFIALLTLTGITQTSVSTARRLMLDGSYQQAEEILEAVLAVDSDQRTGAGSLLEVLQQTREYYNLSASEALGIPARVCGGYSYSGGDPVFHCRNEFMVSDGIWTPVNIAFHSVDIGANGSFLTLSYSSMGGCDAARVYTLPSLEDTLFPAKQSWPVVFPGSLPEAEFRSADGFWNALSLAKVTAGTDMDIQWQF